MRRANEAVRRGDFGRESDIFQWEERFLLDRQYRSTQDPLIDRRAALVAGIIQEWRRRTGTSNISLLDLGTGSGFVSHVLKSSIDEIRIDAVDLSVHAEQIFRRHNIGRFFRADVTKETLIEDLGRRSYDVVISCDVIEHLIYPGRLLRNMESLLRDGGVGIISAPYHGLLKNFLIVATGRFDRHFDVNWDHIRFFSEHSLRELIRAQTKFRIVKIKKYGRFFPLYGGMIFVLEKDAVSDARGERR